MTDQRERKLEQMLAYGATDEQIMAQCGLSADALAALRQDYARRPVASVTHLPRQVHTVTNYFAQAGEVVAVAAAEAAYFDALRDNGYEVTRFQDTVIIRPTETAQPVDLTPPPAAEVTEVAVDSPSKMMAMLMDSVTRARAQRRRTAPSPADTEATAATLMPHEDEDQ